MVNLPGKATIQIQSIEEFSWLNSSYSPVLKQLGSPSAINYYFKAHRAHSDSNMKFRNPKYLSILNHLRFYLPAIFPKLNKVVFLDDDIVVQKDLTGLWSLDLKGNVNGAVETCGESFHRFDKYLNFSNELISKNFDPRACGWAYGMNIFDLEEWKRQNITDVYHTWQKLVSFQILITYLKLFPFMNLVPSVFLNVTFCCKWVSIGFFASPLCLLSQHFCNYDLVHTMAHWNSFP